MNKCRMMDDLYPLYHDGLLNEETSAYVKRHLQNCPKCREKFEPVEVIPPPEPTPEEIEAVEELKRVRKKARRRSALISLGSVALAAVLVFVGLGAWYISTADERLEYLLYPRLFDGERARDDWYIPMPEIVAEKRPTGENPMWISEENISISFPAYGEKKNSNCQIYNATELSLYVYKNGHYEQLKRDSKSGHSWESEAAYRTFVKYCDDHSLTDDVAIRRFLLEYPADSVTPDSPRNQIEMAHVVKRERWKYWYTPKIHSTHGDVVLKTQYYPVTGAFEGVVLYQTWLENAVEVVDYDTFDIIETPFGTLRHGRMNAYLQFGDYVCHVSVNSRNLDTSLYFNSVENFANYLGGIRYEIK